MESTVVTSTLLKIISNTLNQSTWRSYLLMLRSSFVRIGLDLGKPKIAAVAIWVKGPKSLIVAQRNRSNRIRTWLNLTSIIRGRALLAMRVSSWVSLIVSERPWFQPTNQTKIVATSALRPLTSSGWMSQEISLISCHPMKMRGTSRITNKPVAPKAMVKDLSVEVTTIIINYLI
jgi:hypothetical protein